MTTSLYKKGLVLGIIILFVGAGIVPSMSSETTGYEQTIYVDDDYNETTPGWGVDHFDNIQDGIDVASDGDTIHVYDGTYYENVVVDKSVTIIGEDKETTIIDGGGSGNVVSIFGDGVDINGFTIRNSGCSDSGNWRFDAGILVTSNNNNINGNDILSNHMGILVDNSRNNIINYNLMENNRVDGVSLFPSSKSNTIISNTIKNNGEVGIFLWTSSRNIVKKNNVTNNDIGIFLKVKSNSNTIYCNIVNWSSYDSAWPDKSGIGLLIEDLCTNNVINSNDFENNSKIGVCLRYLSNLNSFAVNDFIDNTENINFENCIWNRFKENYWDDWNGLLPYYIIFGRFGPFLLPNFDWKPLHERWDYPCQ